MIISFDIPNEKLTRVGDILHVHGYIFDSNLGTTDSQQKVAYLKALTIKHWKNLLEQGEGEVARAAAIAALTAADLSDIA